MSISELAAHFTSSQTALQHIFVITPLNWDEWKAVILISFPVILIDEVFKAINTWQLGTPALTRISQIPDDLFSGGSKKVKSE